MIYCNNEECKRHIKFDKPEKFIFSKYIIPFKNDLVCGKCTHKSIRIHFEEYEDSNFKNIQSVCDQLIGFCMVFECLHNKEGECQRVDILIDKSLISGKFICKCFSHRKISGHVDWFRNLNSDGTAKGGMVPDSAAKKMKKARF
jgi:hypothetical protein